MALFKKKSSEASADDGAKAATTLTPQPEKARKFFEHAQAAHDSTNYAYAMTLWLQGLRQDPTSLTALDKFSDSAARYLQANPKAKGPTKEQLKTFDGKGYLDRFLVGLLHWGTKPENWHAGLKAMEASIKLDPGPDRDLSEQAYWIGQRVLARALGDEKAKKEHFVALMNAFQKIGAYDEATRAGEQAMVLDPRDAKLEHVVKNMSAQAAMSRGGFDEAGKQGGFRSNVRNLEQQRELEEEERVVKSEQSLDRQISLAKQDFQQRQEDDAAIAKLARLLLERGTPDDEKNAVKLLLHGYKVTGAYKFKADAGDVQMRVARRQLAAIKKQAEAKPEDESLRAKLAQARQQFLEFEIKDFAERVKNYPTDLKLRYELGKRLLHNDQPDEAIEHFQAAQDASAIAAQVQYFLGQAFLRVGYLTEATNALRASIEAHASDNDDFALELRYALMDALQRAAEENDDPSAANEAFDLAVWIASRRIGFKDIRDRRAQLDELKKKLKTA